MTYKLGALPKYFSDIRRLIKNTGLVFLTAGVMTLTGCGETVTYEDGIFVEKHNILISESDLERYEVSHKERKDHENGLRITMEFKVN